MPKKTMRTGSPRRVKDGWYTLTLRIDEDFQKRLAAFIEAQLVAPSDSETVRVALDCFLKKQGF
jgi:hypothetical protein